MHFLCVVAVVASLGASADRPLSAAGVSPQVIESIIHASPAELWKIWSTAEGFKMLGSAKCDVDFRIGGLVRSVYDPTAELGGESTIENQIIAYEPEHMVAFRIHQPPKGFPFPNAWKSTWSVATMTDLGDGTTRLRLASMGYDTSEESQKMREFFSVNNAYVLKVLQAHFDAATPAPTLPAH